MTITWDDLQIVWLLVGAMALLTIAAAVTILFFRRRISERASVRAFAALVPAAIMWSVLISGVPGQMMAVGLIVALVAYVVTIPLFGALASLLLDLRMVREAEAAGARRRPALKLTPRRVFMGLLLTLAFLIPGLLLLGVLAWGLFLR